MVDASTLYVREWATTEAHRADCDHLAPDSRVVFITQEMARAIARHCPDSETCWCLKRAFSR